MWVMRIEETLLREFCSKHQCEPQLALTLRATSGRDGTPRISLAIGNEVVGEWTDMRSFLGKKEAHQKPKKTRTRQ